MYFYVETEIHKKKYVGEVLINEFYAWFCTQLQLW